MDRETIYQFGLSSGCIDPDLSGPDNWVTDYGGCEGCLTKFAQLVAEHERDACAAIVEKQAIDMMRVDAPLYRAAEEIRQRHD